MQLLDLASPGTVTASLWFQRLTTQRELQREASLSLGSWVLTLPPSEGPTRVLSVYNVSFLKDHPEVEVEGQVCWEKKIRERHVWNSAQCILQTRLLNTG